MWSPDGPLPESYLICWPRDKESRVDSFAVSGADFWYSVPNHQVRAILHDLARQVVPPGYLLTVGPGITCFAAESFIDEMADLVGSKCGHHGKGLGFQRCHRAE